MRVRIKGESETKRFLKKVEKRKDYYGERIADAEYDGNDDEKSFMQGLLNHICMIEKFLKTGHSVELNENDLSIVGCIDDDGHWIDDDSLIILGC